ncbi:unnamed protein product [Dicrocoelium dendriticum]|nr:unnamed protein product [Dicrocoelium dendriticum]
MENLLQKKSELKLLANAVQGELPNKQDNFPYSILGGYNLYVKRASFKDDVLFKQILDERPDGIVTATPVIEERIPIAADETEQELTNEERQKREEFKSKRRALALEGADGLDLKAVLSNRAPVHGEELDEEDGEGHKSENDDSAESQEEEVKICVTDHDKQSEINRPSIS